MKQAMKEKHLLSFKSVIFEEILKMFSVLAGQKLIKALKMNKLFESYCEDFEPVSLALCPASILVLTILAIS